MIKKSELLEEIKRLRTELSLIKCKLKKLHFKVEDEKKFFEPTLYKIPIQKTIKLEKTKLPKLEEMTEKEIEYLKKDNHLEYYIKLLKEEKNG